MISTVLWCSMGAELLHIRFGNTWFSLGSSYCLPPTSGRVISTPRSTFCACPWVLQTNHEENKGASNILPCDGVLIPIVIDPIEKENIKKRSPEVFLFSRDPPEKGNESGQAQGNVNCVNKPMELLPSISWEKRQQLLEKECRSITFFVVVIFIKKSYFP